MKKVLLISPQAMATQIFTERARQLIQSRGIAAEISSMSEADAIPLINNFDLIILSPQLRFLLSDKQALGIKNDLPIEVLNSKDFGKLDPEAVLQIIVSHM